MNPRCFLICAMDQAQAIGRNNELPWQLPDDLKRFKQITRGKPILMGRKTAESLGRALPGRRNFVLSRRAAVPFGGMEPVPSVDEAFAMLADQEWIAVIGGGQIYAELLPRASRMYLTRVATRVENPDAFFPQFDQNNWRLTQSETHAQDDRHAFAFEFQTWERIGS